ncbi:MAG: YigZ family protein [Bacillota bacterium]|nr:YigZ family protein [Bacillota bacterium]
MANKIILAAPAEGEITEKKSKFIGYCANVSNEEEAQEFVASIKKQNWDATHNVYAYQIGEYNEIQRSSDDGEPSGTAGRPVLEVIKGSGLSDTAIVVTRYFGGILLGTGGLVRSYSKAAQAALDGARRCELRKGEMIGIFLDYDLLGKVENYLIRSGVNIDHIDYLNNAAIYCLVAKDEREDFIKRLREMFPHDLNYTICNDDIWLRRVIE